MSNQVQAVLSVVMIAVIALVGLLVLSPFVGVVTDAGVSDTEHAVEPVVGESDVVKAEASGEDSTVKVLATRGNAVAVDGQGYVDADPPAGWNSGSWSVLVVAEPDTNDSAWNPNATHNVVAVNNSSFRIDYDAGQWAAYYDNGTHSALARVPATANQTPIVVTFNDSSDELAISADGTTSTDTLDTSIEARNQSVNWVGTIDEHRFVDGALNASQTQTYQSDPIDPLQTADHSARWLFDEGEGTSSVAYYNGSDAELVNAGWGAGVRDPGLTQGSDYELEYDPLAIVVLDGGYLDGSPVVYLNVAHPLAPAVGSVVSGISGAYSLIPVVLLVLVGSVVITVIVRLRQ